MKIKIYSILAILFFVTGSLFAQTTKILAKFIISDGSENGVDITPYLLKEGAYIVFYTSDNDGLVYMANFWPKTNSQSFGPMYSFENTKKRETYDSHEADIFYFNWRYINSYDSKKGTAKVQLIKIYKPQGVAFILKIIPEDLDILIYKGYMEGTINFSDY